MVLNTVFGSTEGKRWRGQLWATLKEFSEFVDLGQGGYLGGDRVFQGASEDTEIFEPNKFFIRQMDY